MNDNHILDGLNSEQRKAAEALEGPVLILAGAGSGKTRVLVHRIAWLLETGTAYAGNIAAITFTNKAAGEMKERVGRMIGPDAELITVSTFHSLCVKILRNHADRLGYTRYFSIYDSDDQLTLMKTIFKAGNISTDIMKERSVLAAISSAKDELIGCEQFAALNTDFYSQKVAGLYREYQKRLKASNAMDFDDLIYNTDRLFEEHPDVLEIYQDRFRYLMVDEYQDTNTAQFRLVDLLSRKRRNLCVVGDDDQSIYKFRGANIRNILEFEKVFPDALTVRLEQNYRSTERILAAANEVISNNRKRKDKKLWSDLGEGEKVDLRRFPNGFEEAEYVIRQISADVRAGRRNYRDCAILYRTNAQSRLFEEKCLMYNVPYRIVGGVNFYQRREIKDVLAYLRTIDNGADDLSVRRILNVPKRGIGGTTLAKIDTAAQDRGVSFFTALTEADQAAGLNAGTLKKLQGFSDLIMSLRKEAETMKVSAVIKNVLEKTGYSDALEEEGGEEAEARLENIDELISKAVQYEESAEEPSLSGFLEEVALIADIDETDAEEDRVWMMTLHSAKGLEFPCVYMVGMEEGLFPGSMAINADDPEEEIEEERRLAYVGMTRAKQKLVLTCARERMIRGDIVESIMSRFVREVPRELVDTGEGALRGHGTRPLPSKVDRGMRDALSGSYEELSSRRKKKSLATYNNPYTSQPKPAADPSGTAEAADLAPGDKVRHAKFGSGTVLDVSDGGRDLMITVDFPGWGVKKMLAGFARLKKE